MIQKIFVLPENQNERLDKFLTKQGINFELTQKLIRQKKIKVNQDEEPKISHRLESGSVIEIPSYIKLEKNKIKPNKKKPKIDTKKLALIKNSIIFKDDNLIIIDKPHGLSVQGGSGITFSIDDSLEYLKFEKKEKPILVHRLDKDTSGALLIARNKESAIILTEKFRTRKIKKTYLALVRQSPKKNHGTINIPLIKKFQKKNEKVYSDSKLGKEAITNYKLLKNFGSYSLLELEPLTGRTHQIRVHLKEIGNPIIGDYKYNKYNEKILGIENRLHLHSFKVIIDNFFGKEVNVETKIPFFARTFFKENKI